MIESSCEEFFCSELSEIAAIAGSATLDNEMLKPLELILSF